MMENYDEGNEYLMSNDVVIQNTLYVFSFQAITMCYVM